MIFQVICPEFDAFLIGKETDNSHMNLNTSKEFQQAFLEYHAHTYNTLVLTGKQYSGLETESLLFMKVSDNYVALKDDIVKQLGEDPGKAPALLGFMQSFMNYIYQDLDKKADKGYTLHPHPIFDQLQDWLVTLSNAYHVDLDIAQ